MGLYRIYETGASAPIGVIVAKNKSVASAYAQGKYGSGSSVERVSWKQVLEAGQVCEVVTTHMRQVESYKSVRVIT